MTALDFLLLGIVALAAAFALRATQRRRKRGDGCGGDCTRCGRKCK